MTIAKTIAFCTLGCKLNFAETSSISQEFAALGFKIVDFKNYADVYVINSCTVTATANKKSRNAIQRAYHLNPAAVIAVTGCYAQLKADEIKRIHKDIIVVGNFEKDNISGLVQRKLNNEISEPLQICHPERFIPAYSIGNRTRSFLKIQDGCDYKCSYCTIPLARGKSRNQSIENTAKHASILIKSNINELVLTGVNIGDFGKSTNERFIDLLKRLDSTEGMVRIRIGSIEPDLLSDEIIAFMAASKHIMPHFHIPLQSGSNTMLRLMRRRYTTEIFADRIRTIKKYLPLSFVGCDVIVGMRGESEKYFEDSYTFIESQDISFIHVFSYSEREHTDALAISGPVGFPEIQRRSNRLHQLSALKHKQFYQKNIGQHQHILWESSKKNMQMFGFTENYIKAEMPYEACNINTITHVELIGLSESGNMKIRTL